MDLNKRKGFHDQNQVVCFRKLPELRIGCPNDCCEADVR